uniref:Secreted protein n=1 Tax=Knipowitschia caucasica TaxID=637954 RepID=A0AAV2KIU9_KNICA
MKNKTHLTQSLFGLCPAAAACSSSASDTDTRRISTVNTGHTGHTSTCEAAELRRRIQAPWLCAPDVLCGSVSYCDHRLLLLLLLLRGKLASTTAHDFR